MRGCMADYAINNGIIPVLINFHGENSDVAINCILYYLLFRSVVVGDY